MLSVIFVCMVMSLNLQGYIHYANSWLYIESLSSLSEPGALFDQNSDFMSFVPCGLHCTFVFAMNSLYSRIAFNLTEWENWKFESEFENSLIWKRFLFEFLDAFLPLFYIAFYEMKMDLLTQELFSLFLMDEIRRIATESLLPLLLHLREWRNMSHEASK